MSLAGRRTDKVVGSITLLLALFCLLPFLRILLTLPLRVQLNQNEGWNAYFAAAAVTGGNLYPDLNTFMVNNYPPLSFYLVGSIGTLLGENILAGRIISVLAFLVLAGSIWFAARQMDCGNQESSFAAVLFSACLIASSDYVGRNDPQLIGHALGMSGMIVLLREPRSGLAIFGAALLLSLAFFVKHSLIVLPLVLTLWLAWSDRRSALWLALWGSIFLAVGLVSFQLAYGSDLLEHLHSARQYFFEQLTSKISSWLFLGFLPLVVTVALVSLEYRDKYVVLCGMYVVTAFLVGAIFLGGVGVGPNAMFDADIALALAAALALSRWTKKRAYQSAAIMVACVPLIFWVRQESHGLRYIPQNLPQAVHTRLDARYWMDPLAEEAIVAARDIAFLQGQPGPVLCETLALCYWANKSSQVDVFAVEQQFLMKERSDEELVHLIKQQYYAALEVTSLDGLFTPRVRDAIVLGYRIDHIDGQGIFLLPQEVGSLRRD